MTDIRPSGREDPAEDRGRSVDPSTTSPDRPDKAGHPDAVRPADGAGRQNDKGEGILDVLLREGPDAPDAADIEDPDHHL